MGAIKTNIKMNTNDIHRKFMQEAIKEARRAEKLGEVPIGAVIVKNGRVVAKGYNMVISKNDPTMHAEIVAIRKACKVFKNYRLENSVIYVTVEPCLMCFGAIIHSRIKELVFGTEEPKFGAFSVYNVNPKIKVVNGVMEEQCKQILRDFFLKKR